MNALPDGLGQNGHVPGIIREHGETGGTLKEMETERQEGRNG